MADLRAGDSDIGGGAESCATVVAAAFHGAAIPGPFIGLKEMAGTSGRAGANHPAADLEIRAPALSREQSRRMKGQAGMRNATPP